MAEVRPFAAIRPAQGYAERIAALPYDVFEEGEARREVEKNPLSFLAIDRPETIAGDGENRYEKAGELLWKRFREGCLIQDGSPGYYIYELTAEGRSQTGIAGLVPVDDYLSGAIHRHENTRAEKEEDRIRHVAGCMAQTGPIFLAYRAREEIRLLQEAEKERSPLYDFTAEDGVRHRIWRVREPERIEAVRAAFEKAGDLYIADGHHRCAAAVSCALSMRRKHPDFTGEEPWNFILSVLFGDDSLRILDYNRAVRAPEGMTQRRLLERLAPCFEIEFVGSETARPRKKGEFGMYVRDGWYLLTAREELSSPDPVEGLDTAILQKYVLEPVFGIQNPRTDGRISFVGGARGAGELERRVELEGGAAFLLYPTSMRELFAVADAGRLMPPKSTWFEPKLRSGLLIYSLKDQETNDRRVSYYE